LIHRVFSPVASGDFHLPHRDLGISMGSWVAVEPSGMGLPSMLKNPKPFWAEPSYRASVSGALGIIASRGLSTPRYSRDIASSSKQLWIGYL
jgi:hypothetical protein